MFSLLICVIANRKPPSWREPLDMCNHRGMGFARCICKTTAKLAIKGDKNVFHKEKENTEILRAKSRE